MNRYKLTKERLANHLRYMALVYGLAILGCVMVGSLIYSATAPELPGDQRVDILAVSYINEYAAKVWSADMLQQLDPSQKEVIIEQMGVSGSGYDQMILMARLANSEGDIFIMDKETYQYLARQGAFLEVSDLAQQVEFNLSAEATLEDGYVPGYSQTGVPGGIYGLSLKGLPGMLELGFDPQDCYLAFTTYNDNLENSIKVAQWILNTKVELDAELAGQGRY
ncbi:MAG: hypothetical protein PHO66_08100 [Eubacteriales bacterium]|nr:hypothetical protein [Eubacteriales bacterium]